MPPSLTHADDHDLAHDRRDRRELRRDAFGQPVGGQRQPLGDDLPVVVDVGAPAELDVDHRQADAGRRPHGLDAGRAVEHRLERKRDQRFDFLRRHAGRLGHHDDPRPIEIWETRRSAAAYACQPP